MEKIHELLGYDRIKIYQNDEMFSFSLDSMLLADFIDCKGAKRIIDLGCGNAPIPLFLTLKTKAKITGIEIQKDVYDLAVKSVDVNNFNDQIEIINADLKGIYKVAGANMFDVVSSNPPYFKYQESSYINKNDYLTIARHEVLASLDDIVNEAKKLLVDGGRFYMVHRVNRLADVINSLSEHNFGIKKLKMIYPKETDSEALSFLVEARKNKASDIKVLKPHIVLDCNGEYTDEVRKIFNFKKGE